MLLINNEQSTKNETTMNKEEFAAKLNGIDINDLSKEHTELAQANGLVFIYGHSDDLMEIDGCITDEFGCYAGGTMKLGKDGITDGWIQFFGDNDPSDLTDADVEKQLNKSKASKEITAIWCEGKYGWQYKTAIPHATFILGDKNNDEPAYCKAIVFDYKEL